MELHSLFAPGCIFVFALLPPGEHFTRVKVDKALHCRVYHRVEVVTVVSHIGPAERTNLQKDYIVFEKSYATLLVL